MIRLIHLVDINVQLIVSIPTVPSNYSITYEQVCQTLFNNNVQSSNTFVEPILDTESNEYLPQFMPTQKNNAI